MAVRARTAPRRRPMAPGLGVISGYPRCQWLPKAGGLGIPSTIGTQHTTARSRGNRLMSFWIRPSFLSDAVDFDLSISTFNTVRLFFCLLDFRILCSFCSVASIGRIFSIGRGSQPPSALWKNFRALIFQLTWLHYGSNLHHGSSRPRLGAHLVSRGRQNQL